jgi:hypothetical protein
MTLQEYHRRKWLHPHLGYRAIDLNGNEFYFPYKPEKRFVMWNVSLSCERGYKVRPKYARSFWVASPQSKQDYLKQL